MPKEIISYTEKQLENAFEIYNVLKPFLNGEEVTKACVQDLTKRLGKSRSSIYRYIAKYRKTRKTSSLIPKKRGRRHLSRELMYKQEVVIDHFIQRLFLSRKRPNISQLLCAINDVLEDEGLPKIVRYTLENRLCTIPRRKEIQQREGAKEAAHQCRISKGSMAAKKPLELVLMDHTLMDVMVVDPVKRDCIGRPTLTIGIDVYSRAICCFYLSMNEPSSVSLMRAVSHMVLPKSDWLLKREIDVCWPIHGLPDCISTDHGADFTSRAFRAGLIEYGIEHDLRPIARPHYGGIVERFFRTLNERVHILEGTTKSDIKQKGGSDPERTAIYTLAELEKIMITYIVEVYMKTPHSTLLASPLAVWNQYWEEAK